MREKYFRLWECSSLRDWIFSVSEWVLREGRGELPISPNLPLWCVVS